MARYHLTVKGEPGVCSATSSCPLGGEEKHKELASLDEAREWAEALLAEEYSPLSTIACRPQKILAEEGLAWNAALPEGFGQEGKRYSQE